MRLTKNFDSREFACKDGTAVPGKYMARLEQLAINLQVLRDFIRSPITIISGYRTPEYNKKCGGVKNSQHLTASAADIKVGKMIPVTIYTIIGCLQHQQGVGSMLQGGTGLYKDFVHYDIRGYFTTWKG